MTSKYNFEDLPAIWLKQELVVINRILAKASYYNSEEGIKGMLSEFLVQPILPSSGNFYMDDALSRIIEIFKKFENIEVIQDLDYGEGQMQHTTMLYFPILSNLRLYKTALIKELQIKDNTYKSHDGDVLKNGKLTYSIGNKEVKYDVNQSIPLSSTSDYGRFLILLMSNVDKRRSYSEIYKAVGIDYETEKLNPETDLSIKRQIQQIKSDLTDRLKKAGIPSNILKDLIVARDGYKMNKID